MKKLLLSSLLLMEIHAIEMTDYRTIFGRYDEAYINGSFYATTGNQEQSSYDLKLEANTRTIYTTAPYSFEFTAQGDTSFRQSEESNQSNTTEYSLYTSTRYDKYLDYNEVFIYSGSNLGYRKQENSNKADKTFIKVTLGTGYGRLYNATPLAVTLRIMEELLRYKILKKSLSDVQMLDLAQIIGKKSDYMSQYGQVSYKKNWFNDIEKVFIDSGLLAEGRLGSFGVIKIEEIIEIEKVSGRFHGWKIRGGMGQILSSYDGENESTTIDSEFSLGLPIGHSSQYIENARISKNLDNSKPINFQFENSMSYTYEITDVIDWENSWDLQMDVYHEGDSVINNKLITGLRYYLANNLTIDTTLNLQKIDGTNGNMIENKEWDGTFFVGVRYRLK